MHADVAEYEWDRANTAADLNKHGVRFADAVLALEDPAALTVADPDSEGESRFVCLGTDPAGRVLVTVFTHRGRRIRIISARKASSSERRSYESP